MTPVGECCGAALFEGFAIDDVTFLIEVVGDVGVDRSKFLQGLHAPKPEHRPLSSSERQVAVLHPIVGVPTDLLLVLVTQFHHRYMVGFQPVHDNGLG